MTTPDTITPDEYAMLRFPGDVPGLLRRGSPVTVGRSCEATVVREVDAQNIGIFMGWLRAVDHHIALDLTDATGRAHLAWWLAVCIGGPAVMRGDLPLPQWAPDWVGWSIYCGEAGTLAGATWEARCHPLAALDPDDPRLLPDGSRLVDALALSLVARHVAGLEVS